MTSGREAIPGYAAARPGRCKQNAFRALALFLSVFATLAAVEVGLRLSSYDRVYVNPLSAFHVSDPVLGYRGKPNFEGRFLRPEFDVAIEHDELGFRKHVHQRRSGRHRGRLIALGDSFTWGWGVNQGEVFTDLLVPRLEEYEIMNRGISGVGTVVEYTIFENEFRQSLAPGDVVLLSFCFNDFGDSVGGLVHAHVEDGVVRRHPPRHGIGVWLEDKLKDASSLYNLIAVFYEREMLARKRARELKAVGSQMPAAELDEAEIVVRHFFGQLARDCRSKGARLLVAYIPMQVELGESPSDDAELARTAGAYRQAFFRGAESLSLETIDLLQAFLAAKERDPSIRVTFARDEHWNRTGHQIAAQAIFARVCSTSLDLANADSRR